MNPTIVLHTALQRLSSPARVLLVFAVVTLPALVLLAAPIFGARALESGMMLGLILGAGLIGQDTSSGVLQLLFARPVTRAAYVTSRWLGACACVAAAVAVQVGLGAASMALRGAPAPMGALAGLAVEQALAGMGVVSVLALFSSLLPGVGDLMAWLVMSMAGGVLQAIGMVMRAPWLVRTAEEWMGFLSPTLRMGDVWSGGAVAWLPVTAYLSTVTLCLALAIVILNRRQFSYATD